MSQEPPASGDQTIDAALRRVADAAESDLDVRAQALSEAQSVLQSVLRASRQEAQEQAPGSR